MTVNLEDFFGKKVDITLRNGYHFEGVILRGCRSLGQFKIELKRAEFTYRRDGMWKGFTRGLDIVSIKLSPSNKERLEQKIQDLNKELAAAEEELANINNIKNVGDVIMDDCVVVDKTDRFLIVAAPKRADLYST
jgi:hypothetical protein